MRDLDGRCLIDTNVLLYATSEDDPRHARAMEVMHAARAGEFEALISVQNLAEMYPNLTGPKRRPPDSPQQARTKIEAISRLRYVRVIPVDEATIHSALELCEQYSVRRQDYFDMQLVASMLLHDVPTLVTENVRDFKHVRELRVVNPFE